jgi:Leucine-rich repeat (LRR) protein
MAVKSGSGKAVDFLDANLQAIIRETIQKPDGTILDLDLEALTRLKAVERNIVDLSGLESCANLAELDLSSNPIGDLAPLRSLKSLKTLNLQNDCVVDLQPLLDNDGISTGDELRLEGNSLSLAAICEQVPALKKRGVAFYSDFNADTVVAFPDPALDAAVRKKLGVTAKEVLTVSDFRGLKELNLNDQGVFTLNGLEFCRDLVRLTIRNGAVSVIEPLQFLLNLEELNLAGNMVRNVRPLWNLTRLESLDLSGNDVRAVWPLMRMAKLRELNLSNTLVTDILPLLDFEAMCAGAVVDLRKNELNQESLYEAVPAIRARGVVVYLTDEDAPPKGGSS